jgi:hypothetical protein
VKRDRRPWWIAIGFLVFTAVAASVLYLLVL